MWMKKSKEDKVAELRKKTVEEKHRNVTRARKQEDSEKEK